ncbi:hypothetical protein [Amycolatopsis balhimycina]|uniref:hypothetical protein n=1 Tax=Amycolatopsis balhimycina TaxID=208443 RepID=UPI000F791942|nr:hypothetical protein [Amycolatopsis balhimycina]
MDVAPRHRSWIAAVHASRDDYTPLGTAVVLDERRLITSAHVTRTGDRERPQLWVAFPMAGPDVMLTRVKVQHIRGGNGGSCRTRTRIAGPRWGLRCTDPLPTAG